MHFRHFYPVLLWQLQELKSVVKSEKYLWKNRNLRLRHIGMGRLFLHRMIKEMADFIMPTVTILSHLSSCVSAWIVWECIKKLMNFIGRLWN